MKTWRLIKYSQHDAATNMAIDEAMLEGHLRGAAPPTVRLYGFVPAAVTIGYSQNLAVDVLARMRAQGIDVVRRPTGGRAVLHMNELTYSFVGSSVGSSRLEGASDDDESAFLAPSIAAAYKQICRGLIFALADLGVSTALGASNSAYRQVHDCFLATTSADLHYLGTKMVGSAQCRRGRAVLQHGSILLDQDQSIMDRLLTGVPLLTPAGRTARHANLYEVLDRVVPIEEIQTAIKSGFERAFDCELVEGSLSAFESDAVRELREKYLLGGSDSDSSRQ